MNEQELNQFDEKWRRCEFVTPISSKVEPEFSIVDSEKIKSFISTLIAERDKKMVEAIEVKKIKEEHHIACLNREYPSECDCCSLIQSQYFNNALSDAISIITEFNK